MKIFKFLFLSFFFLAPFSGQAATDSCFYYFYGQGCPHCTETAPVIEMLEQKYPHIEVHKFEVWYDEDNKVLFGEFLAKYNIDRGGVPALFMTDKYYMGSDQIIDNLEDDIVSGPTHVCPVVTVPSETNPPTADMASKNNNSEVKAVEPESVKIEPVAETSTEEVKDNWQRLETEPINASNDDSTKIVSYLSIGAIIIVLLWLGLRKK
ncbi:hypothetical protein C4566_03180 [Candidatus Parcubacteria bacterium]|nr:MAG: hypothetical protein C4566_03180 [Candidatus Parcubacteria bacterium]